MSIPTPRFPLRVDRKQRLIFCDESGLSQRYFVLGALFFDSTQNHHAEIDKIKQAHSLKGEVKWEKLPSKPGKFLDGYTALMHFFCQSEIFYKALIVDTHVNPLDHPIFSENSKPIGYFQFYSLLLFNGITKNSPLVNSFVTIHTPTYPRHNRLLEGEINKEARQAGFPSMERASCCLIESSSSRNNNSIQLTDIITGMVSACWNDSITSPVKLEFIKNFKQQIGIEISTNSPTRHADTKFNRWLFQPKIR